MTSSQSNEQAVHELLSRAVGLLPEPPADVSAAVLAEARVRRRRRRVGYSLAATACALAIAAGTVLGSGLTGSGKGSDRTVPAAQGVRQSAYYPVGALLPSGVSDLHLMVFPTNPRNVEPSGAPTGPSATRGAYYSFTRYGKTGYLGVVTNDPARSRHPVGLSAAKNCALPAGETRAGGTCRMVSLPGGATALVLTEGPSGATAPNRAPWDGPDITVSVQYPDQRVAIITAMTSFQSPTKTTAVPLLTEDEVMRMATSLDWFSVASVN